MYNLDKDRLKISLHLCLYTLIDLYKCYFKDYLRVFTFAALGPLSNFHNFPACYLFSILFYLCILTQFIYLYLPRLMRVTHWYIHIQHTFKKNHSDIAQYWIFFFFTLCTLHQICIIWTLF